MSDSPVIFYFGNLQPVRAGDLLRVVSNTPGGRLGGKLFLVMESYVLPDGSQDLNAVSGIIDGRVRRVSVEDLELIDEAG
jgi:hypothetical protein